MNGAEIFAFTPREVPAVISRVLSANGLSVDDVDLFVPHQANAFILAHLQRKLRIPPERFVIDMADCGNTGSSTIAIALRRAMARAATRAGMRVMLVGFGVGYSSGARCSNGSEIRVAKCRSTLVRAQSGPPYLRISSSDFRSTALFFLSHCRSLN